MLQSAVALLVFATLVVADKSDDNGPIGGYPPKAWPAAIGLVLYTLTTAGFWYRFAQHGKQKYMLSGCIGLTCICLGYMFRIVDGKVDGGNSMTIYILMDMFILLSPCAFLAQDYVLLQRLARCLPPDVSRRSFIIPAQKVVWIFVGSDILTFLLQAGGGGMEAQETPSAVKIGQAIALSGLSIQLASFTFFTISLLIFRYRLRSQYLSIWNGSDVQEDGYRSAENARKWRKLYYTLCTTCIGILIRSVFRIAEYAQGFSGYLTTHEAYFFTLDAFPLWVAMSLYLFVWPPLHLVEHEVSSPELAALDKTSSA